MKAEVAPVQGAKDPLIQEMQKTLAVGCYFRKRGEKHFQEYEKLTRKRIYVLNSLPRTKTNHIRRLNSFIKKNTAETGDFGVIQTYQFGQERINEAVKR